MSGMLVRRLRRGAPVVLNAYLAAASASQVYTAYKAPIGAGWAFSQQGYGATLESGGIRIGEAGSYLFGARGSFTNGSGNIGVGFMRNGSLVTPFNMQGGVGLSPVTTDCFYTIAAGELWSPTLYCSVSGKTPSAGDTATAVRFWAVRVD